MTLVSDLVELSDLAAEQWGLVTTAQAVAAGVSRQAVARMAASGALERVRHGVHRVAGGTPDRLDGIRAAWLSLDPTMAVSDRLHSVGVTVVSHRSAADLLGLGDLDADRFEFTAPIRKQSRVGDIAFHRGGVPDGEWAVVDYLPVTTAARTIADLAAVRTDGGHLARVVRDAIVAGLVGVDEAVRRIEPHRDRYGPSFVDAAAAAAGERA